MNFSISVVIPNYNGQSLLADVLPSVVDALSSIPSSSEIIIADDNSTDDSIRFINENFPQVIVLKNDINLGFSGTVNKGILAAGMDLVFILNNDVKLIPGYFEAQLPLFERDDTFGVNGAVLDWDSDVLQGGGKIINRHLFKIKANENYFVNPGTPATAGPWLTMFLSGTNALIDRKKLVLLKGYDHLFSPFYVEDVELSVRAMRMDWKMYYSPSSKCMHQISTTINKYNKKKKIKYMTLRNKFYLHFIHLNGLQLIGWYTQTLIEILFRTLTFNGTYLKAFSTFLKTRKLAKLSKSRFEDLLAGTPNQKKDLFSVMSAYREQTVKNIEL